LNSNYGKRVVDCFAAEGNFAKACLESDPAIPYVGITNPPSDEDVGDVDKSEEDKKKDGKNDHKGMLMDHLTEWYLTRMRTDDNNPLYHPPYAKWYSEKIACDETITPHKEPAPKTKRRKTSTKNAVKTTEAGEFEEVEAAEDDPLDLFEDVIEPQAPTPIQTASSSSGGQALERNIRSPPPSDGGTSLASLLGEVMMS
jgi:hypothetical protein